ncbi:capping protein (actin filament), gelsolin-like b [Syngnathoides biaculeatus]|uniref:capping protein (actin filament), gelsolin-like b n=1 Tax=Syngnathoides biaculeatus TaxID=300417 RepID=UPI002ADDA848|nr:capping protein (actin filament), gelsolin-like b [Syngnathoides biaculeatus]XP_061664836.1 capping protein (actin filament), gelsolin-like b [Syngnathoides biaculeatus]
MLPFQPVAGQFGPEVRVPGLHVWRVEKMKAVPLPLSEVGVFYNGDSYLVLENRGQLGADLHMWIGEKSSHDEQVACAMLAIQLDTFLSGDPVQHRQVQGYESQEFMTLFPRGVSYKDGGVESGFRRPQSAGSAVQRLYQIKGKRNIRAKEVELSWKSFNKGDCFILDLGKVIVPWIGSQANVFEKQKVREIASLIRDADRHGKARIVDSCEGEEPAEMLQILGPKPELPESTAEEDSKADASNAASLYKVSDATGSMLLSKVEGKSPFAKELLLRDDCFILDNGANGKIFVWKGAGANAKEKQAALQMADNFIQQMNYPKMKTQVEILPQGKETVMFKQFFKSWN